MSEEKSKEAENIEIGQYTINEARQRVGLKPLTDPAADLKLFVQRDH